MFWKKKPKPENRYNVRVLTFSGEEYYFNNVEVGGIPGKTLRLTKLNGYVVLPIQEVKFFDAAVLP